MEDILLNGNVTVVMPESPPCDKFKGPEFKKVKTNSKLLNSPQKHSAWKCSACDHGVITKSKFAIHPILKVLVCQSCSIFYHNGRFTQDEEGIDEHCRWCGEGGNVILCNDCSNVFCRNCIRRNFGREYLAQVTEEEEWFCFVCHQKPLKYLQTQARRLKTIAENSPVHSSDPDGKLVSPIRIKKHQEQYYVKTQNQIENQENVEPSSNHIPKDGNTGEGTASKVPLNSSHTNNGCQENHTSVTNVAELCATDNNKVANELHPNLHEDKNDKIIYIEEDEKVGEQNNETNDKKSDDEDIMSTYCPSIEKKEAEQTSPFLKPNIPVLPRGNHKGNKNFCDGKTFSAKIESYQQNLENESDNIISSKNSENNLGNFKNTTEAKNTAAVVSTATNNSTTSSQINLSVWQINFQKKYEEGLKVAAELQEMVKNLVSFENTQQEASNLAASARNSVDVLKKMPSPSKFKQFKTIKNCQNKISKICLQVKESEKLLEDRKNEIMNNNMKVGESSDEDESMLSSSPRFPKINSPNSKNQAPAQSPESELFDYIQPPTVFRDHVAMANEESDSESMLKNVQMDFTAPHFKMEDNMAVGETDQGSMTNNINSDVKSEAAVNNAEMVPNENDINMPSPEADQGAIKMEVDSASHNNTVKTLKIVLEKLTSDEINKISLKLSKEQNMQQPKNEDNSDLSGFSDMTEESESDRSVSTRKVKRVKKPGMSTSKPSRQKKQSDEEYTQSDLSDPSSEDNIDSADEFFDGNVSENSTNIPRFLLNNHGSLNAEDTAKDFLVDMMKESEEDSNTSDDSDIDTLLQKNTKSSSSAHSVNNKNKSSSTCGKYHPHPLLKRRLADSSSGDESSEPRVTRSQYNKRKVSQEKNKNKKRRIWTQSSESDSDLTLDSSDNEMNKPATAKLRKSSGELSKSANLNESVMDDFLKANAEDSDDFIQPSQKSRKRKKRIKVPDSDEESPDVFPDSQSSIGSKIGRKNIHKIRESSKSTQQATAEEALRRKRVQEIEKSQKEDKEEIVILDDDEESNVVPGVETPKKVKKLILSREPLIEVDIDIAKYLKDHQILGVRFLWSNVIESVTEATKKGAKGGGCILAHCMGLGKTLQTITFLNTVLSTPHLPSIRTALIVCPKGTVLNWEKEFNMWLNKGKSFVQRNKRLNVYQLNAINPKTRHALIKKWHKYGGVLLIGYGLYRSLLSESYKRKRSSTHAEFVQLLRDPGPDILVCDEGHILKNAKSSIASLFYQIKTSRKIILTGTPLQNNLEEYHCMVSLVKPRLLGGINEFRNRFINPIKNGQMVDSTPGDVKKMKKRAHVLHQLLTGCVQRRDYTCLLKDLQPKFEYVISVRLTPQQIALYKTYLGNFMNIVLQKKCLFKNFQTFLNLCAHPYCLKLGLIRQQKRASLLDTDEDCDGFIISSDEDICDISDDDEDDELTPNEKFDEPKSKEDIKKMSKKALKWYIKLKSNKPTELKTTAELIAKASTFLSQSITETDWSTKKISELKEAILLKGGSILGCSERSELIDMAKRLHQPSSEDIKEEWFEALLPNQENLAQAINASNKMVLLLSILEQSCELGDKVVVFSQSLLTLSMIEKVLTNVTTGIERNSCSTTKKSGKWFKNLDYFRLDGSTSTDVRDKYIRKFNSEDEPRARLFLISTRAGGIGINLIGANRAIIFDASWNPSHDIQSIFRIYRFGQKKACYIYRFVSHGTMEEKIYERQVVKQSLSYRVIDEQQVDRHFTSNDIAELYKLNPAPAPPKTNPDKPRHALPKDKLLANLLKIKSIEDAIVRFHEHDTLLDNQMEEDLTPEERKAAWEEYGQESKANQQQNTVPTTNSPFAQVSLMNLQNLERHANLALKRIDNEIRSIKLIPLDQLFTTKKLQYREHSVDAVNEMVLNEHYLKITKISHLRHLKTSINKQLQEIQVWLRLRMSEFQFNQRVVPPTAGPRSRMPTVPNSNFRPTNPVNAATVGPRINFTGQTRPTYNTANNPRQAYTRNLYGNPMQPGTSGPSNNTPGKPNFPAYTRK